MADRIRFVLNERARYVSAVPGQRVHHSDQFEGDARGFSAALACAEPGMLSS